jgi:hypothetical protein
LKLFFYKIAKARMPCGLESSIDATMFAMPPKAQTPTHEPYLYLLLFGPTNLVSPVAFPLLI